MASVLAADPHLEAGSRNPPALHRKVDQLPDRGVVEAVEGVVVEQAELQIVTEEPAGHIVTRESEGELGQVVTPDREEVGVGRMGAGD